MCCLAHNRLGCRAVWFFLYRWCTVRGVHRSVQVRFMPNPWPTRWHRVSDEKTRRRPQKPTGQVRSDPVGRRSGRSKLKICYRRFKSVATTWFFSRISPDLSKTTRSEQNNTISLLDLRKTHRILAKNYQIFVGFEKNSPNLCRIWAKPSKLWLDLSKNKEIWAKVSMFLSDWW